MAQNKKKTIKSGLLYNGLYQLVFTLVPLITTPYISRVLGADGYGLFNYSVSIAYYFFIFGMMGVNMYGNREVAKVRDDKDKRSDVFWQIYYLQLFFGLISTIAYIIFVINFISDNFTLFLILSFYVGSVCTDINWYAFGLEEFKLMSIRNITVKIISTICIFMFVKTKDDLIIYFVIYVAGLILGLLPIWPLVFNTTTIQKPNIKKMFSHLKPNFLLFLPYIASSVYQYMDKVMLGTIVTESEVGYYNYAENILAIPLGLTTVVTNVMLPRSSYLIKNGMLKESNGLLATFIKVISIMNVGVIFGILIVSDIFVSWYLGSDYNYTAKLLCVISPILLLSGISTLVRNQLLIPCDKEKQYLIAIVSGAVVNLVGNILLIKNMHAVGACITTILANIVILIVQNSFVAKEFSLKKIYGHIAVYTLCGIGMYFLLMIVKNNTMALAPYTKLLILIPVGIFIYLIEIIVVLKFILRDGSIINLFLKKNTSE